MVAGEAYLQLDNTSLGAKRAVLSEADDAAFTAVGLYAVLDSKQLAEEFLCHCEELVDSLWAGMEVCWMLLLKCRTEEAG